MHRILKCFPDGSGVKNLCPGWVESLVMLTCPETPSGQVTLWRLTWGHVQLHAYGASGHMVRSLAAWCGVGHCPCWSLQLWPDGAIICALVVCDWCNTMPHTPRLKSCWSAPQFLLWKSILLPWCHSSNLIWLLCWLLQVIITAVNSGGRWKGLYFNVLNSTSPVLSTTHCQLNCTRNYSHRCIHCHLSLFECKVPSAM